MSALHTPPPADGFAQVIALIQAARGRAYRAVNTTLIDLYWQIGEHIWSKRELERQLKAALFERVVLSPAKVSPVVRQTHPQALEVFKDTYMVEFLGLPDKALLQSKLHEFYLPDAGDADTAEVDA